MAGPAHRELSSALALFRRGKADEADRVLDAILGADPDQPDALYLRASIAQRRGERDAARSLVERAVALRPGAADFRNTLGNLYLAEERVDEAIACYRAAIERKPDLHLAYNNLGAALRRKGELAGAVRCWRTACALKRGSPWYRPEGSPAPARGTGALDTFTTTASYKLRHDIEQYEHLLANDVLPPAFGPALAAHRRALADLEAVAGNGPIRRFDPGRYGAMADAYNRLVHWRETGRVPGGALDTASPVEDTERRYRASGPGIVAVDGLLRPEALEGLRRFCLDSTIWFDFRHPQGYLGAYVNEGFNCDLLFQVAEDLARRLPGIFRGHPLRHLWAYKYDRAMTGIGLHADEAAVNVNFWVTPDDANLDRERGGLVVYDVEAPQAWDFAKFNNDVPAIERYLREAGARPVTVPYRANRAVIFNSDLFHTTDDMRFTEGYGNRRVNITLLFGDRCRDRESPPGLAGPAPRA